MRVTMLTIAMILAGCAHPAPKPAEPAGVPEILAHVPPLPERLRDITPPFKDQAILILPTDDIEAGSGESSMMVDVPWIPDAHPLVCFDLPGKHVWQCLYIDTKTKEVSLVSVRPTREEI